MRYYKVKMTKLERLRTWSGPFVSACKENDNIFEVAGDDQYDMQGIGVIVLRCRKTGSEWSHEKKYGEFVADPDIENSMKDLDRLFEIEL